MTAPLTLAGRETIVGSTAYIRPAIVSASTREMLLGHYPALRQDDRLRSLLGALISSTFVEDGTHRVILPYTTVAWAVGMRHNSSRFRMGQWLERLSSAGIDLDVQKGNYRTGRATTVHVVLPEEVQHSLDYDNQRLAMRDLQNMVLLATGEPFTEASRCKMLEAEQKVLAVSPDPGPPKHPAQPLLECLASQPTNAINKIIKRNMPDAIAAATQIPNDETRRCALKVLRELGLGYRMCYEPAELSPRVHSHGPSPDRLPKAIRRTLLKGCVEIDIVATGLTIVSHFWNLRTLKGMFGTGERIWDQILRRSHLTEADLPLLKKVVLATIYGLPKRHANAYLRDGVGSLTGLGPTGMRSIVRTKWMRELRYGVNCKLKGVRIKGYVKDVFGRVFDENLIRDVRPEKKRTDRVLMSLVIQALELRILLAVIPIIQSENKNSSRIRIASWLHDGLTLHFVDKKEAPRQIRRIEQAIRQAGKEIGIPVKAGHSFL